MSNIKLFQDKKIRTTYDEKEQKWYFSVVDIIEVLTESVKPRDYWYRLKKREKANGIELSTNCRQFKMLVSDGKMRETEIADLLKMYAYKDAIRRTGGAYILYPGNKETRFKGFHELIPGLVAFSLNPNNENNDVLSLSNFIDEVIDHLINNASQRENIASKSYNIHKSESSNIINEPIPEYINGEKLIPDETYVLVGYSTSKERLDWFLKENKYIFRMDGHSGSLELNNEVVNAKYLLLRENGKSKTASKLFKIKSKGPEVYSSSKLKDMGYPESKVPKEYYLSINIELIEEEHSLYSLDWRFKDLKEKIRNPYKFAGTPFTTSLTKLMSVIKKD